MKYSAGHRVGRTCIPFGDEWFPPQQKGSCYPQPILIFHDNGPSPQNKNIQGIDTSNYVFTVDAEGVIGEAPAWSRLTLRAHNCRTSADMQGTIYDYTTALQTCNHLGGKTPKRDYLYRNLTAVVLFLNNWTMHLYPRAGIVDKQQPISPPPQDGGISIVNVA